MADDVIASRVIDEALLYIEDRNRMGGGITAMRSREREFGNGLEMRLAGMAMVPEARDYLNSRLTEYWEPNGSSFAPEMTTRELVIGSGPHAAIYCATRVRMGFPKPYVVERADAAHVGGIFAISNSPSWYLNSENRKGLVGLPRDGDALNYLPGALIQPSFLSTQEFQTNADMALAVRLTLAQFAIVIPGMTVTKINAGSGFGSGCPVIFEDGTEVTFGRVIDARGLGDPTAKPDSKRVMTFPQFMSKMDETFPFQGIRKMAIIGGGDSGKCAAEAAVGIGPSAHMSIRGLDQVERVDWYSNDLPTTKVDWRISERGRYQRLSSYLPDGNALFHDITVLNERGSVAEFPDGVLVNSRNYDLVVMATGNTVPELSPGLIGSGAYVGGSDLRLARDWSEGSQYYIVGPAANIGFTASERDSGTADIAANKVALFRLAPKTAAFAASLSAL